MSSHVTARQNISKSVENLVRFKQEAKWNFNFKLKNKNLCDLLTFYLQEIDWSPGAWNRQNFVKNMINCQLHTPQKTSYRNPNSFRKHFLWRRNQASKTPCRWFDTSKIQAGKFRTFTRAVQPYLEKLCKNTITRKLTSTIRWKLVRPTNSYLPLMKKCVVKKVVIDKPYCFTLPPSDKIWKAKVLLRHAYVIRVMRMLLLMISNSSRAHYRLHSILGYIYAWEFSVLQRVKKYVWKFGACANAQRCCCLYVLN